MINYKYLEEDMRKNFRLLTASASIIAVAAIMGLTTNIAIADDKAASSLEEGKKLAFDRKKGNCLACHLIQGGEMAGTIGPPLIAMKARFKRDALIAQISEPRDKNPNTIMPPFGAHSIMSSKEIELVADYVLTL
ncbi:MAG: sulfur oxidation c-type cytochrome SoxX [Thiotrichaceae bacterium]